MPVSKVLVRTFFVIYVVGIISKTSQGFLKIFLNLKKNF